ncbi:MAG: TonB-dependent receptor [Phenylobacterium sp.]|nr:TonB-dependent receptor [Phenylobacterium sp.]
MTKFLLLASAAFAGSMLTSAASAQTNEPLLDEIVVVAQKKEERLQDVPVSVGVVQGANIERLGLANMEQLSRYVPNFTVAETGSGNRITMRGISSGTNRGFEQSVGLFNDGIYGGRNRQFTVPFFDVERVEVLKGPQGVLFGKNTVAGAVSIVTAKPTHSPQAWVAGAYETQFGKAEASGVVSGPLSDTFAARLAVRFAKADEGFLRNTMNGKRERSLEEGLARASFVWDPMQDLKVSGKYEYAESKTTGTLFQLISMGSNGALYRRYDPQVEDRLNQLTSNGDQRDNDNKIRSHNAALRVDYDFGQAKLVSQTGYSAYKSMTSNEDSDFTPVPLLNFDSTEDFSQFSQEVRYASSLGERFSYTAGVYYQYGEYLTKPMFSLQGTNIGYMNTRNRRNFDQSSESYSVFAEGVFKVTDQLKVIAGARYNDEQKDVHRSNVVLKWASDAPEDSAAVLAFSRNLFGAVNFDLKESRSEQQLSPALTVQYDFNDDVMAYAKATRAYKSGGFDASDTRGTAPQYEDEQVTAYEAGVKARFGGAIEVNASVFNATYKDLQVQSFNGISFLTTNAGEATSRGAELDGRWKITPAFLLSGSVSYLDAQYDEYVGAACTYAQSLAWQAAGKPGSCVQDLSGRPLTDAPPWSASMNLNFHTPLDSGWSLDANLGFNYRAQQYVATDLDPISKQAGYTTWDANVQLLAPDEAWDVSLVAKNIFDERAMTYVASVPIFSGSKAASIIEPRTVELRATRRF